MNNVLSIIVAASNSNEESKQYADFVCTGTNDEIVIQKALEACAKENKKLELLNGIYNIDAFYDFGDNGPKTAISIPKQWKEITITGQNHEYGFQKDFKNGVVFYVSSDALNSTDSETDVIRGKWTSQGIQNGSSLHIENLAIILANNEHAIRCVDLRRTDRVEIKNMTMISYGDLMYDGSSVGLDTPPPIPQKGCIGLTMTDGSNYDYSNYTNVQTWGFDEGIQVGGEHVVCINCGAQIGNYGFTFGNYELNCGTNHPITMINCLDERNINMPLFNACGDGDGKGNRLQGRQEVSFINFNIERVEKQTPGGKLGDCMREIYPGTWCGKMEVTVQPAWCSLNSIDCQLWENDGSGTGIRTVNSTHKTICDTAERMSYYPTYGQQIFDTDLNKMVICIDPAARKWVDFNGVEV